MRIFFLLVLLVAGTEWSTAQSKEEKKAEKEQAVKEKIESRNYSVDVNTALPRRGISIHLTSSYSLEVRNDSLSSWLPYYGRAYSIPYGGGDGLTFKAPIEGYKLSYDKRGTAKIEFTAHTKEDLYEFNILIFTSGSSSISVNMHNRDSIDFSGELNMKKNK
ncbi:MAG: hypothetical protein H6Q13_3399 [Bacteroidetes bacterium]|nr:hypothetical protein [Bacteroidota bacterium]